MARLKQLSLVGLLLAFLGLTVAGLAADVRRDHELVRHGRTAQGTVTGTCSRRCVQITYATSARTEVVDYGAWWEPHGTFTLRYDTQDPQVVRPAGLQTRERLTYVLVAAGLVAALVGVARVS